MFGLVFGNLCIRICKVPRLFLARPSLDDLERLPQRAPDRSMGSLQITTKNSLGPWLSALSRLSNPKGPSRFGILSARLKKTHLGSVSGSTLPVFIHFAVCMVSPGPCSEYALLQGFARANATISHLRVSARGRRQERLY